MKKKYAFFISLLFLSSLALAQKTNHWKSTTKSVSEVAKTAQRSDFPETFVLFELNKEAFKQQISVAADRFSGEAGIVITMPNAKGNFEQFTLFEASNFDPELQAQYPEIRSYIGIGIEDPTAQLRMSVDPTGIQTMVFRAGSKTEFMEPYGADGLVYAVFESNRSKGKQPFTCFTPEDQAMAQRLPSSEELNAIQASNGLYKTLRLAISCTGEYAQYYGGTVAGALGGMNATMTRVNGVFERDFAVKLLLIPTNNLVIYLNPATDPYSDAATGTSNANTNNTNGWNLQVQNTLTSVLGNAAYDIGHLFGASGGGGNAGCIGCVCVNDTASLLDKNKGSAYTSPSNGVPAGDSFDIDFVAHEMGHQLGATHTFSHAVEGAGVNIEPGSGSTIMAYAGVTGTYDMQSNSDAYFTYRSILQVQTNLLTKTCPITTNLSNPTLSITGGGNWTIPRGTAFILTGTNPSNNSGATFTWEQNDNANSSVTAENSFCFPTKLVGPNFRSITPTSTPVRYMPSLTNVLNNALSTNWESVSTVGRTLNFTLTARDNRANGGQTATATAAITVNASVGPFEVTSQNTEGISWNQGTTQTITWAVNGTTALVGSANVDILLSTDGGQTFGTVLAANTPNDGNQTITVPNVAAPFCRIMIKPTGNIYYAVNSATFAIGFTVVNSCTNYTFNTPFAIPDNTTTFLTRTINVPAGVTITDVNVGINLTHTWLADLRIAMLSPGGTQVDLFNRQCGNNDNLNVTFDDAAGTIVCAIPTQGTYAPFQALSAYNGQNSAGNWVFGFNDNASGDTGNVSSITLQICSQQITLSTPNFGIADLTIYPNPNQGAFTLQFSNPSSDPVTVAMHDMRGRLVFERKYESSSIFEQSIQTGVIETGVYLVNVTSGERKEVRRIVIQ